MSTLRAAHDLLSAFPWESSRRPSLTIDAQGQLCLSVPDRRGGWVPLVFEEADLDAPPPEVIRECNKLIAILEEGAAINARASATPSDGEKR